MRNRLSHFLIILILAALCWIGEGLCVSEAHAQTPPPPPGILSSASLCDGVSGAFLEKTVTCATTTIGAIATQFMNQLQPFISGIFGAVITLAVVFFGVNIMYGRTQLKMGKDAFIFIFKICGLLYFAANLPQIYTQVVTGMEFMMEGVAKAAVLGSNFCVQGNAVTNIWARWDCMLGKLVGFGGGATLAVGIVSLIIGFLWSGPIGWVLFFVFLFFFFTVLMAVLRAVNTFLMAWIGLAFLFLISFLFVPLVLFKATTEKFMSWLALTLSYAIMPVVTFAFLGFATVVLEQTVFSGPFSLYTAIAGGNPIPANQNIGEYVQSKGAHNSDTKLQYGSTSYVAANDAACGKLPEGGLAGGEDTPLGTTSAEDYTQTISVNSVDASKLIQNTGLSLGQYFLNIITTLLSSIISLYVIYAMLMQLGQFVFEIATGGRFVASNIGKAQMPGEAEVRKVIDTAVDAAMAYATGGASLKSKMAGKLSDMVSMAARK